MAEPLPEVFKPVQPEEGRQQAEVPAIKKSARKSVAGGREILNKLDRFASNWGKKRKVEGNGGFTPGETAYIDNADRVNLRDPETGEAKKALVKKTALHITDPVVRVECDGEIFVQVETADHKNGFVAQKYVKEIPSRLEVAGSPAVNEKISRRVDASELESIRAAIFEKLADLHPKNPKLVESIWQEEFATLYTALEKNQTGAREKLERAYKIVFGADFNLNVDRVEWDLKHLAVKGSPQVKVEIEPVQPLKTTADLEQALGAIGYEIGVFFGVKGAVTGEQIRAQIFRDVAIPENWRGRVKSIIFDYRSGTLTLIPPDKLIAESSVSPRIVFIPQGHYQELFAKRMESIQKATEARVADLNVEELMARAAPGKAGTEDILAAFQSSKKKTKKT